MLTVPNGSSLVADQMRVLVYPSAPLSEERSDFCQRLCEWKTAARPVSSWMSEMPSSNDASSCHSRERYVELVSED